jgi:RNA polymerase sigma factor (sigma-70 family)
MAAESSGSPFADLRLFLSAQTPSDVPDRELLDRFLSRRDEAAFAALVHRHGPMVLAACRRALRDPNDAEDACQATFVILSRKAAAIRKPDALVSWLHGVAVRVARDLRATLARRAARPLAEGDDVARRAEPETLTWAEVREALDEELCRLPGRYRAALVLCYLEGRSRDEAALQLGLSLPALRGRLERGRGLLHARLARRGLALSAGLVAVAVAPGRAGAVPARLFLEIVRSATGAACAAALAPEVTALVNGALTAMTRLKKKCFVALAFVGLFTLGGYAAYQYYAAGPPAQAWTTALAPEEIRAEETVRLSGQVLDADGRPHEGAELFLAALFDSPVNSGPPAAKTDKDGRFTLATPKSELARHLAAARPVDVVAVAKGFGMAWRPAADFLPKEERDKVGTITRLFSALSGSAGVLKLARDDNPLTGRIETPDGKPVAGASVRLEWVYANDADDLTAWKAAVDRQKDFFAARQHLPRELGGDGLGRFAATTDKEGRFRLTGLGSNRVVGLRLGGPGLAAATIVARTQRGSRLDVPLGNLAAPDPHGCFGAEFTMSAGPARPIVGVVRDADTGRPIPGAVVQSHRFAGNPVMALSRLRTRADAEGRYRLDGMPAGKGNALLARGPADQPYLPAVGDVDTGEGDGAATFDLKLKRGLWAEGQVTDAATGRPLAADIEYYCFASNPRATETPGFTGAVTPGLHHTDAAGRFRVPVLPGRGIVAAALHGQRSYFLKVASTWQAGKSYSDYSGRFDPADSVNDGTFVEANPAHFQVFNYHQMAVIDPAPDAASVTCDLPVHTDGSPLKPAEKKKEAGR